MNEAIEFANWILIQQAQSMEVYNNVFRFRTPLVGGPKYTSEEMYDLWKSGMNMIPSNFNPHTLDEWVEEPVMLTKREQQKEIEEFLSQAKSL